MVFQSSSSTETERFGKLIARRILARRSKKNSPPILALQGGLGSGKTTFVKGFFRGMGLTKRVVSPTFVLVRRSKIKDSRWRDIYHVDAYRIKKQREFFSAGLKEIIRNPRNIVLIEWADNIRKYVPRGATWILFFHGRREHERIIKVKNSGMIKGWKPSS